MTHFLIDNGYDGIVHGPCSKRLNVMFAAGIVRYITSHIKSCLLLLMLLIPFITDAASVRRRLSTAVTSPCQAASPGRQPWSQPCGGDPILSGRVRRSTRSRHGYWQRRFHKLGRMATSMVNIADEVVQSYVSTVCLSVLCLT